MRRYREQSMQESSDGHFLPQRPGSLIDAAGYVVVIYPLS